MATYFDGCTSLTGWTEQGIIAATQFSIVGGAIESSTASLEVLSLNAVDSDADRQDFEVLIKVKFATFSGTNYIAIGRGSGTSTANADGYLVAVRSTAIRTYSKDNNATTQIQTSAISALSTATWYWVRFRVNSTTIRARIWGDGGSEPGTWNCDTTDTVFSADGYVGTHSGATAVAVTVGAFGVGTNGDTAPSAAATAASFAFGPRFPMAILNF